MAILPVNFGDILYTGENVRKEREQPVRIAVFVDADAPDELVDAFQKALTPATRQARIHVELVSPGEVLVPDPMADAVIALAGPGTTLVDSLRAAREALIPAAAVALEHGREAVAQRLMHPVNDTIADPQVDDAVAKTGNWLVERDDSKKLAMATNFAFMRRAVAEESVRATSMQNGLIGGVLFIPGADMPVMTANQAKMIMQVAAVYGQPLGSERIKELAMVVGGGFALRAVARQFVGLVPGFGWAVKAGIGYSGTWAMGKAAIEYFENGGTMQGVAKHVSEARQRAIDEVSRRRRGGEPIPVDGYVVVDEAVTADVVETTAEVVEVLPAPTSEGGEPVL